MKKKRTKILTLTKLKISKVNFTTVIKGGRTDGVTCTSETTLLGCVTLDTCGSNGTFG
jgi:hypothetical protein